MGIFLMLLQRAEVRRRRNRASGFAFTFNPNHRGFLEITHRFFKRLADSVAARQIRNSETESIGAAARFDCNFEGEENFVGDSEMIIALGGASNETKDRPLG